MAYFRGKKVFQGVKFVYNGSGTIIEKSITANGTYFAISDNADGYSKVTVNVPATQESTYQDILSTSYGTVSE